MLYILDLINEFSKVTGYKINIQKSIVYIQWLLSEKLRKHSHLPLHLKLYLGINLHNAKTCTPKTIREIEDDTNEKIYSNLGIE